MKRYEALCEGCFRDLYKVSLLITDSPSAASSLVERACVRGVQACRTMKTESEVKRTLTGILYALCVEAQNPAPTSGALASLSPDDRRLIAFRYCSGLRLSEFCAAVGLPPSSVKAHLSRITAALAAC